MMKGGDIAGLLIRQARLRLNWSQEGLCRGICAPSYLSKIEQGKAEPTPEVTELLLRRLGLVWIPEPEDLKPCWNALPVCPSASRVNRASTANVPHASRVKTASTVSHVSRANRVPSKWISLNKAN